MSVCLRHVARLALLGFLGCVPLAHAEAPFIVGIATHLMNFDRPPKKPLMLTAEAGFNSVKDDIFWSTAAPTPHELRITPQWRNYLTIARELHLSRLAILGYSTYFHDNRKPRTPEVMTPFLNYVDYVTRQLGNRVSYYEIWNEWDLEASADPQLALDYVTLVQKTVPVIRKNTRDVSGPQAKILAGSVTPDGMKFGFADPLIESGALDLVDGLSVHPYAHCAADDGNTPEAWVRWMADYEQYIRTKAGRDVPIYLTEMGWPSHQGPCGKSKTTQALYMARIYFLARTVPNVKGMWWFDLYNDGPDRYDQEHNFGLLNEDLSPKPAYTMMNAIAPVVRDFTYDARASSLTQDLYQLHFSKGEERVVVAWAIGKPRDVQVTSESPMSGPVQLIDTAYAERGEVDSEQSWACEGNPCTASINLIHFPKIIRLSPKVGARQIADKQ
ncbi:hypothetical protein BZK31_06260 [Pseudomonas floridensis]|uniref:Beta-xylosidase n=1 Tax=Pseudomonas floridensis TaxID=1958950 RepID=A0A1X0NAZ4_9PSED|nr:hypothetical protein [Pseudomonas floridensis]ORC60572.1 hypothetical protein BZK31_06260 [Pseudomonas floridensis]